MPRVIAITNFKGGIGKTTTTVNISAGFALKGAKMLVIDADVQNNTLISFGVSKPQRSLYDVLVLKKSVSECVVPARPNIDLLASSDDLIGAQAELSRRPDWGRLLETALRPVIRQYDFIIIDCSASMNILNMNALMASSDILVPTALEPLAIEGLKQISRNITKLKGTMGSLRLIIPTMFDARNRQSHHLLESLRDTYGSLVAEPIRINIRLSEAPAEGKTIYEHDPRSNGATDYAALVEKLSHMFGFTPKPVSASPQPVQSSYSNGHHQPEAVVSMPQHEQPLFSGPTRDDCPHCGQPLQQILLAGYRVHFCDNCKYKRQELASGVRR